MEPVVLFKFNIQLKIGAIEKSDFLIVLLGFCVAVKDQFIGSHLNPSP